MGAAASAQVDLQSMLACTLMLSQAMSRAYPDIYTPLDFHADKTKMEKEIEKQQNAQMAQLGASFRMVVLNEDGTITPVEQQQQQPLIENHTEEEEEVVIPGCIYVDYGDMKIPIKKSSLDQVNSDGWNVLHACSHQSNTVEAAELIIEEMVKQQISLDKKTARGPGSFACDWSALHIACAYGVEDTVRRLLESGSSADTTNSVGWTPIYEAIHRGYSNIVEMLLRNGARTDEVIPANILAPYHPQLPLAHACRQGHLKTVEALIRGGVDIDAQSEAGWTALHESVFFRNLECVKLLLSKNCNTTLKSKQGYTVLDFETTAEIKEAIQSLAHFTPSKEQAKIEYRLLGDLPDFNVKQKVPTIKPVAAAEEGTPEEYACQLTGKLLSDPVTTVHGNHFEKAAILAFLTSHGNMCPVTGLPLSACEIKTDNELRIEINEWQLKLALGSGSTHNEHDVYDF